MKCLFLACKRMSRSGVTCLILGPEGSGKTLLVRKLQQYCNKNIKKSRGREEDDEATHQEQDKEAALLKDHASIAILDINQTIPTVGTNLKHLQFSKEQFCTLKEYGGQLAPIWCAAYRDASMIIYVIDSSNQIQVSASTILLLDLLSSQDIQEKPILIFFNKTDLPLGLGLVEYKSVMRLDDIIEHATQTLTIVDGSCWSGRGIDVILDWIMANLKSTSS